VELQQDLEQEKHHDIRLLLLLSPQFDHNHFEGAQPPDLRIHFIPGCRCLINLQDFLLRLSLNQIDFRCIQKRC
jgi:hypothetical protein